MPPALVFGALAVGGTAAGVIGNNNAANATREAAATSDATQRYIYDDTVARNAYRTQVGNQAVGQIAGMYGLTGFDAYNASQPIASAFGGGQPQPNARSGFFGSDAFNNLIGGAARYQTHSGGGVNLNTNPQTQAAGGAGTRVNHGQQVISASNTSTPQLGAGGVANGAMSDPNLAGFYNSPDFKLAFNEGLSAIEGGAAARGGLLSGSTLKGVTEFGQNLAGNTYGNYLNTLNNLGGMGQQANQATTAAGNTYANAVSQNAMAVGNANAARSQANGNAIGGLFGFGAGMYGG